MADQKVSDLPSLNGADVDPADLLYIIDSSAGSAGSKKITVGQYQLAPVSGGTANGVLYLNASKVATAGSDLVFDGNNLGIGTSSPSAKLHVVGNQYRQNDSTGSFGFTLNTTSATTTLATLFGGSSFAIQTANSGTDQFLLDSSGNLGLGVTPSAWGSAYKALQVTSGLSLWSTPGGGAYYSNNIYFDGTNRRYIFSAAAAEYEQNALAGGIHKWSIAASGTAGGIVSLTQAMTLDASGNLLVGTADAAATATTNGLVCSGTNPGFVISRRSTGAAQTHLEFRNGGANVGNISSSTTTTTYATTSDRRLKDNIVPAPSASNVIDAIQIVSHDWKSAPDEHVTFGAIAQDLALVAPQAVLQGDDGDEIEKTWGVDYSKLVPMLIKEIQTLRARVAALESA